jgi:hypothetical protein
MSVSHQLRLRFLHLRAVLVASLLSPAAIAGSISASVATLVVCMVYGSVVSGSICFRAAHELRDAHVSLKAVRPAALQSLATHEPYSTEPPSFLASHRYQGICNESRPQHDACTVEAYNPSSPGQAQPCTPDSLRHWDGSGSWFQGEDGHYRWARPSCATSFSSLFWMSYGRIF